MLVAVESFCAYLGTAVVYVKQQNYSAYYCRNLEARCDVFGCRG